MSALAGLSRPPHPSEGQRPPSSPTSPTQWIRPRVPGKTTRTAPSGWIWWLPRRLRPPLTPRADRSDARTRGPARGGLHRGELARRQAGAKAVRPADNRVDPDQEGGTKLGEPGSFPMKRVAWHLPGPQPHPPKRKPQSRHSPRNRRPLPPHARARFEPFSRRVVWGEMLRQPPCLPIPAKITTAAVARPMTSGSLNVPRLPCDCRPPDRARARGPPPRHPAAAARAPLTPPLPRAGSPSPLSPIHEIPPTTVRPTLIPSKTQIPTRPLPHRRSET